MNKQKAVLLAAVVLVTVVAGIFLRALETGPGSGPADSGPHADAPHPAVPQAGRIEVAEAPPRRGPIKDTLAGRKHYDIGVKVDRRVTHTPDGKHIFNEAIDLARQMHTDGSSPDEDIMNLNETLTFYRMVFNENPVAGDNQSVMAALMGDNARGIVVFPSDHPSLNARGELVDRWETPYYFHALSSKMMEIVSPGPDRKLGTLDDIIFTERDESHFFRGITDEPDPDAEG